MFGKRSRSYSIFKCKCPRCHEGDMFTYGASYNIKKMMQMHDHCEHCGLKFTPEPGFYYGAMYVSYGFSVLEFVAVYLFAGIFFNDLSVWSIMGLVAFVFVLLSPLNFRLGRSGWLNIFHKYDSSYAKKQPALK